MTTATIDELRTTIDKTRTDLARREGQQESNATELATIESEVEELGLDLDNLTAEAETIKQDVGAALADVQKEIAAVSAEGSDE